MNRHIDPQPGQGGERDQLLDHNYDGIQEYDNPLPGWWLFLFWACIAFAPCYIWYYHVGLGPLVKDEYAADEAAFKAAEAERALKMGEVTDDGLKAMAQSDAVLAEARGQFVQTCKPCHGEQGQGGIGPNLTDDYYLHGGKPTDLYHTIYYGVEGKGMQAWGETLPPTMIRKLAAFVYSLRGTNPPNPKAPQGEKAPPQ